MEQYLRAFKYAGDNYRRDTSKPAYQLGLEEQAMQDVANELAKRMGLGQNQGNSLFRWTHKMGLGKDINGADDIFEAELYNLLNIALEKATITNNNKNNQYGAAELVGNLPANINQKFIEELQIQGQGIINRTQKSSEFINIPQFRSGKVDVKGYNNNFIVSSHIKAEWQDFINTFSGVNMTLKNYSSASKVDVIHLGNTNPTKAILASLGDLGYSEKPATHIYYHLTGSKKEMAKEGHHIIHLRFAYELTGGKLVDQSGQDITKADFFVYNDPSSGNIWVRSTKEMIANMTNYATSIGDPLHSGIAIAKTSFK